MKEKSKLQFTVTMAYTIVFVLFVIFAIYMGCMEGNSVYQARPMNQCEILEDYAETTIEDSSAPVGVRIEYRFKLSDISAAKDYLAFYVVHHYADVYIDGELIYSLSTNENNKIGASPSSNWVFVPLEQSDNGKDVQVVVTPVYKSVVNRKIDFMIGTLSDIVLNQLRLDSPQLALAILCIFIGIILIIIQPIIILLKKYASREIFFLLGVWRITDVRFSPILFSENTMVLGYIAIASLFICGIPLVLFVQEHFNGFKKKLLLIDAFVGCVVAFIVLICQVFQIAEFRELLILCHIVIVIHISVITLVSTVCVNKDSEKTDLRGMVLLIAVGALGDLMSFYWKQSSAGVVFTVLALLIYAVFRVIAEIFNINRKVHIDAQTGLFNRHKWNDMMEVSESVSESVGVMMLDLNRLKYINDTMGHKMGDKLIVDFADILRKVLSADCMVFRWGGDEFTVLVSDANKDKMDNYVSEIYKATEVRNLSGEKPEIYFATGYALSTDYPSLSREELMKKADEKMYYNKSQWYQKNVPDYHL